MALATRLAVSSSRKVKPFVLLVAVFLHRRLVAFCGGGVSGENGTRCPKLHAEDRGRHRHGDFRVSGLRKSLIRNILVLFDRDFLDLFEGGCVRFHGVSAQVVCGDWAPELKVFPLRQIDAMSTVSVV